MPLGIVSTSQPHKLGEFHGYVPQLPRSMSVHARLVVDDALVVSPVATGGVCHAAAFWGRIVGLIGAGFLAPFDVQAFGVAALEQAACGCAN